MVIESGPFEAIDRKRQQSQKSSVWRKYEEGGSKGGGGSDLFKHCASIYHTSKNSNQNMCGTETWVWGILGKLKGYNDSWLIDYVLYFRSWNVFLFCLQRSSGIDGCELMCCNRGYKTRRQKRVERCKCKFHWCCFVECEECYREVEVSTCN